MHTDASEWTQTQTCASPARLCATMRNSQHWVVSSRSRCPPSMLTAFPVCLLFPVHMMQPRPRSAFRGAYLTVKGVPLTITQCAKCPESPNIFSPDVLRGTMLIKKKNKIFSVRKAKIELVIPVQPYSEIRFKIQLLCMNGYFSILGDFS